MLVIEIDRELPVAPDLAFALVTQTDLMNRWSEARIEHVRDGDGDHPGGVGALRRVHATIARRAIRLDEVIEHCDPPHRLQYRVFAPSRVRRHVGVITLDPTTLGTHLRWRVEIDLGNRPLEWITRAALAPSLERSVDAMAGVGAQGIAQDAHALPPSRNLFESELASARELRLEAEACLAHQRDRANALLGRNDDRGWFARVYEHVTEGQLRGCDDGVFDHPAWVMRLVIVFHRLWDENLARRLGEHQGDVETHWQRAHSIAEHAAERDATSFVRAMRSIRAGMRAHIEDDLPRAIAKVYWDHYRGVCDPARFRADYLRMNDIFVRAGARLRSLLPRDEWTLQARVLDTVTPESMREASLDRWYYPITMRRREAFDRAERIVRMFEDRV